MMDDEKAEKSRYRQKAEEIANNLLSPYKGRGALRLDEVEVLLARAAMRGGLAAIDSLVGRASEYPFGTDATEAFVTNHG